MNDAQSSERIGSRAGGKHGGQDGSRLTGVSYPLWVKVPYAVFVAALVPVYWANHGPANFLWFSDIALFIMLIALWTGSRLLASMMAVGILPFELVWVADFVALGNLTGTAAYMFDDDDPMYLRVFSGFHLFVPLVIIWMLRRQGYDKRAYLPQMLLMWSVLVATYLFTEPHENINLAFGLVAPQTNVHPLTYLGLYLVLLPVLVMGPTHVILRRVFPVRCRGI
jgi:hypothetical protein